MKTIYIDCGAYTGTILARVMKKRAVDEAYAFECSPWLRSRKYNSKTTTVPKAVWVHDGELTFYVNHTRPLIQGHSAYKEKTTGNLDKQRPVTVPCVDWSAWLLSTFHDNERLIVKMNIEGAEYDVLEKCVADGTLGLITELHVSWHWQKCRIPKARHDALVAAMGKVEGLQVFSGNGHLYAK